MGGGVVGLDLSLARTGMCFVPDKWDGRIKTLQFLSVSTKRDKAFGSPELLAKMEIQRCLEIAGKTIKFIKKTEATAIAKENYAFSPVKDKFGNSKQSSSVTKLAELGGVVLSQVLLSCRLPMVSVPVNSARKWLTGGIKRGDQKGQIERFLKKRGLVFENYDEMDAFVVAYYWYGELNKIRSRFLAQSEIDFGAGPGLED